MLLCSFKNKIKLAFTILGLGNLPSRATFEVHFKRDHPFHIRVPFGEFKRKASLFGGFVV